MKQTLKDAGRWLYLALTGGASREWFDIHGVHVRVPAHVDRRIRFFLARRRYENAEARLIRAYIDHGEHVVELGGALGVISSVIRDQIGLDAQLTVLEANPAIVELCRDNACRAAPDTTQVIHAALAYGADVVTLNRPRSLLDSSVMSEGAGAGADTVEVAATALGPLIAPLNGQPYALVCDIEGAEMDLMRNDAEALRTCSKIIMEVHEHAFAARGLSLKDLLDAASACGFRQEKFEANNLLLVRN